MRACHSKAYFASLRCVKLNVFCATSKSSSECPFHISFCRDGSKCCLGKDAVAVQCYVYQQRKETRDGGPENFNAGDFLCCSTGDLHECNLSEARCYKVRALLKASVMPELGRAQSFTSPDYGPIASENGDLWLAFSISIILMLFSHHVETSTLMHLSTSEVKVVKSHIKSASLGIDEARINKPPKCR